MQGLAALDSNLYFGNYPRAIENNYFYLLLFFVFAALIHFGIMSWRLMTGKDRWSLTKTMGYSIIIASLAFLVMIGIVIIF